MAEQSENSDYEQNNVRIYDLCFKKDKVQKPIQKG